jgi:phosphatidylglycerol lysyltransferase
MHFRVIKALIAIGLFSLAGWILYRELHSLNYHVILAEMARLPGWRLIGAALLTICSYLLLTCYDMLALRYVEHPLPYRQVGLASFLSYAFSNTIGLSLLTSGTIRYQMYSSWGLKVDEIGRVVGFAAVTFWLGILTVGGGVFSFEPQLDALIPSSLPLSGRPLGFVFLLVVAAYLLLVIVRRQPVRIWKFDLSLPHPRLAILQTALGAADWLCAAGVFVTVLPDIPGFSFGQLIAIYLAAQILALISSVPGGIGVFESIILLMLPGIQPESLLGSLLVFRGIYYLAPLVLAGLLVGLLGLRHIKIQVDRVAKTMERWTTGLAPHLLSTLIFVAGAVLLFSGATPAVSSRLSWLEDILPLPVIELSHFLGSLVGACLLLLARGLQKRLDAAYVLSVVLLGFGIAFSLLKGGDYEEAVLLTILLISLLPCRQFFRRRASLLQLTFSWGWIGSILVVFATSTGLILFAHKYLAYSSDLWWQFALEGDAPRSLRAGVGAAVLLLLFALARLLRTLPPVIALPDPEAFVKARRIIAESPETVANLALLGDKQLLINESGTGMIMYAIEGRSWVALGDPIGPESLHEELIWQFRDRCEQNNGWPIFYEVGARRLHLYLDIGLNLLKVGEEARVFLPEFSLVGKKRSGLRHTDHRMSKDGYRFSIEPAAAVPAIIDELKAISDSWLAEKNTREKGFSLGFFEPAYLAANPVALVYKEERIVAFANIWTGSNKDELSVDLMRYDPAVTRGVMEYLFVNLMLWGKEQGFSWFNLGMAPLSGLENRAGAPLWNRFGALLFRHGENFYNFQGLREYKEKFDPQWEPRYLASPGGLALPLILTNIAALISGGVKGVFRR